MFVLAIDTSSPAVTAAIVTGTDPTDGTELALAAARTPLAARGHGELLSPAIADVLEDAGITARDVCAVVAGTGPGPFTGLRVGLVTAAAFADAIGVPAYGVCSLDAIGALYPDDPALLVATDARRREVYWAAYVNGVRRGEPSVGMPAELDPRPFDTVAGAGGELYSDAWPGLTHRPARYPDPLCLVALARDRLDADAPTEVLTPRYLRRPDATVPGAPKAVLR